MASTGRALVGHRTNGGEEKGDNVTEMVSRGWGGEGRKLIETVGVTGGVGRLSGGWN